MTADAGADDALSPEEWVARFAEVLGVDAPDEQTVNTLLDLAGAAAHSSARTAAPIACYLVGVAGTDAARALEIAEGVAS